MDQINSIAWFLALLFGGLLAIAKIEQWWIDRRLRKIRDEVVSIAREVGIDENVLACKHGVVVGDECRICDRE